MKPLFAIALCSLLILVSCNNSSNQAANSGSAADTPPIEVTAVKLLADYEMDEPAAEKIYGGRNLIVTGAVMSIETKHDGKVEILLNSDESSIGSVRCHFDVESAKALVGVQRNDSIVVKGICANMDSHIQVVINNAALVPAAAPVASPSAVTAPVTRLKLSARDRKMTDEVIDLEEPVNSFLASNGALYAVIIDTGAQLDDFFVRTRGILEKHKSPVRWIKAVDWNTEDSTNLAEPFGRVVEERKW